MSEPSDVAAASISAMGRLRVGNLERVVDFLRVNGPHTQSQIADEVGLSRASISNLVKELLAEGKVETKKTTQSGRRALLVSLADHCEVVFGLDLDEKYARVALIGNGKQIISKGHVSFGQVGENEKRAAVLAKMSEMLTRAERKPQDLVSIGIGLSTPIDSKTGEFSLTLTLPKWITPQTVKKLGEEYDVPIVVANDASLAALGEATWGKHKEHSKLLYVLISRGIGAGFVTDGQIFFGSRGLAGEIGHMRFGLAQEPCRCGNRGCLETEISSPMMIRRIGDVVPEVRDEESLLAVLDKGDVVVRRMVNEAGGLLGDALANLSMVLDPEVIVVGGSLISHSEDFISAARERLQRGCLPAVADEMDVFSGTLEGYAVALGAAAYAAPNSKFE